MTQCRVCATVLPHHMRRYTRCVSCREAGIQYSSCPDCGGEPGGTKSGGRCRECRNEKARVDHLKRSYGITAEQYDQILERQGGVCAICQRPPKKTRLAVDHEHRSGEVFGLLCTMCNYNLLGVHGRAAGKYERAAEYLTNPPAREVLKDGTHT